jgi:hypothetical protein
MDAPAAPQILIDRCAWPDFMEVQLDRLCAHLKDVGVLIQTLYAMATDMGLGGCAIGTTNIDLFAKMTGSNSTSRARWSICHRVAAKTGATDEAGRPCAA